MVKNENIDAFTFRSSWSNVVAILQINVTAQGLTTKSVCVRWTKVPPNWLKIQYGRFTQISSTKVEGCIILFEGLLKAFEMFRVEKLLKYVTRATNCLNRRQIRGKTQDVFAWKMDACSKDTPFIVVQSPYTVKIQPVNPMEYIENVDTDGQSVKGNVYLETDDEGDLAPDLKNSFMKDINFNVTPVSSNSKDYLEVKKVKKSVLKEE